MCFSTGLIEEDCVTRPLIPKCSNNAPSGVCTRIYFPSRVSLETVWFRRPLRSCDEGMGKRRSFLKNRSSSNRLFKISGDSARFKVSTSGSSGIEENLRQLESSSSFSEFSSDFSVGVLAITTWAGRSTRLLIMYPLTNSRITVFSSCSADSSLVNAS